MSSTRRSAILLLLASALPAGQQLPGDEIGLKKRKDGEDEDVKLPNGKSQKDAMSKQAHEDALKEVESLIHLAEELRDELRRSGNFVVAISSLKKTEEIEKLARRIRGKLKA